MEGLDDIKDSTFVNVGLSLTKLQRALKMLTRKGVRGSTQGVTEAEGELKANMLALITSPLSQIENPKPMELSGDQIGALRALYTVLRNDLRTDEELKASVMLAVKSLNPAYNPKVQKEVQREKEQDEEVSSLSLLTMAGRSERIAQLPHNSCDEGAGSGEMLLDNDESGKNADVFNEVQMVPDDEVNEGMDGIQITT